MLVAAGNTPPNSTSPLSPDYFTPGNDLYSQFAAGLTIGNLNGCVPGLDSFAAISPAGTIIPMVIPAAEPALSQAILGPAPVSPLATQVQLSQQSAAQALTAPTQTQALSTAVNAAGQEGATSDGYWPDAVEVIPMGTTANMVAERSRQKSPGNSRRSYDLVPTGKACSPPWGGAAMGRPQQSGNGGWTLGMWLFLAAGAGIITMALLDNR